MRSAKQKNHQPVSHRQIWPELFAGVSPYLWLIVALAAVLRLPHLWRLGLWLDEVYVFQDASKPVAAILNTPHFVHFLVIKPLLAISTNKFFLRLPSLVFGLAAIPIGFAAARLLVNKQVGYFFTFLLAASTFLINYSIDANYYSHMVFWVLMALLVVGIARVTSNPYYFLALPPIAAITFFVHPFSALFFASLALYVLGELVLNANYFQGRRGIDGLALSVWIRIAALAVVCVVMLLAIFAVGGGSLWARLHSEINKLLSMLALGKSPSNIHFSYAYFQTTFLQFGNAFYGEDILGKAGHFWELLGGYLLFALYVWGGIRSWRMGRFYPFLLVFPFLFSFGLIFNLDAKRFFHIRYFSYLVPLYLLAIAIALDHIVTMLAGEMMHRKQRLIAFVLALIFLFSITQYAYLFFTNGRNWDAVMPAAKTLAQADTPLVYMNWAEKTLLDYYTREYGMESQPSRPLHFSMRRTPLARAELMDWCYRTPELLFFSSWRDIQSQEAVAWAESHMQRAASGRSLFAPSNDVTLYAWSMGGHYVLPPRILHLTPEKETPLIFEQDGRYAFAVYFEDAVATGSVSLAINKQAISLRNIGKTARGEMLLHAGRHTLSCSSPTNRAIGIDVIPLFDNGRISISPVSAFTFYPSDYVCTSSADGSPALILKRNTFATYAFGVENSGTYRLQIEARNDKPGPVMLDVRMDGKAAGILSWDKNDNSYESKSLPVQIDAGNHELSLAFVNEGDVSTSLKPDEDRDAIINGIVLSPDTSTADERMVAVKGETILPLIQGAELSRQFRLISEEQLETKSAGDSLCLAVPASSKGCYIVGPMQSIKPGAPVYWSIELKAKNLQNHSANSSLLYCDGSGHPLSSPMPVNAEGITGTTDWARFVCYRPAPKGVAGYRPLIWVYGNSRKPSSEEAMVCARNLRIEN